MLTIKEASLVTFLVLFSVIVLVLLQGGTDMESETHTDSMQEVLVGGWRERDPNDDEIKVSHMRSSVTQSFRLGDIK